MGEGGRRSLSIYTMGSNEAGSDDGLKDAGRGLDISMNHLSLGPSLVIDRRRFCQDDELDQCNIPTPTMKVGKGFTPLSVRGTFPTQDPGDGRRRCFTGMENNLTDDLPTPTNATTHHTASATTFKADVTMSTASANVRKFHFGPSAGSLSTIRGTCDGDDGHYHDGASSPNEVNSPHSPEHSPERYPGGYTQWGARDEEGTNDELRSPRKGLSLSSQQSARSIGVSDDRRSDR